MATDKELVARARRQADALNETLALLATRDISAPVQTSKQFMRDDLSRYWVGFESIVKTVQL